ncbi:hypothetical protein VE03_08232 [Pseudogymnoascus sp. 23342-1-I1]|nr:hypothetical protein VE03_08208 [Pseudogymnoascus sp. 23342-1-I1]OBT61951.1 hypothetical protein VE03_08232 [Pseudogymnoascus sp. 23342-1-I1]
MQVFQDDGTSNVCTSTTVQPAKHDPTSKLKDFVIHISEIDISTGRMLIFLVLAASLRKALRRAGTSSIGALI